MTNMLLRRADLSSRAARILLCAIVGVASFAPSTTAIVSTAVASSPLVAAYALNEGSGTTTADASGNGLTGTVHNTTWTNSGKFGTALSFNGSTAYVDLGAPASLRPSGSMSWEAWVFATANPTDDGNIVSLSNGSAGWQLKTSKDTGPRTFATAVWGTGAPARTQRYSNTVITNNTWYHVAGVYNAAAQTLDIYVNGALDNGTLRNAVPSSQQTPAGTNANIGRRSTGLYFIGTIDEVRIYAGALTAAEVQADMNTPLGGG